MHWIPRDRLASEPLLGTFLGMGSPIAAEIAGKAGFDWVLVDTEHGAGDYGALVQQLQALSGSPTAPIVRVAWNDPVAIKRALDAGASGIMVPYVNDAKEAAAAVAAVKYPPAGIRGVARSTRAAAFGVTFEQYLETANDNTFVVAQIETPKAVANADQIAATEGVDALFVGPLDLRVNLGWPHDFDAAEFERAVDLVVDVCRAHSKAAGILTTPDATANWISRGMRLVAIGSDSLCLVEGFRESLRRAAAGEAS